MFSLRCTDHARRKPLIGLRRPCALMPAVRHDRAPLSADLGRALVTVGCSGQSSDQRLMMLPVRTGLTDEDHEARVLVSRLQRSASMRKILCFSLVLLPALPAFAARTLNLSTVVGKGTLKLKSGESQVTIRAPKGQKLSRSMGGMTGTFVPISGRLNAAKSKMLFSVKVGRYYASPLNAVFSVKK
jgi:hypothetical protein